MTNEQSPATSTIAAKEPNPVAATTAPATAVDEPTPKDPFPTPTEAEIKENGFYYYFLPERERPVYKAARESEGLKDVIGLMQVKIMEIQFYFPENVASFFRAMSLLDRLVKTHARYFRTAVGADAKNVTAAMPKQFSPPPGIDMNRAMRREMARR